MRFRTLVAALPRSPARPLLAAVLVWGCGTSAPTGPGADDDGAADDDAAESSGEDPTNDDDGQTGAGDDDESSDGAPGTDDTGADSDDGAVDGGCVFLCQPDGAGVNIECDVWAQDCPSGEKCMPWANDGGSSWNATRCSPLDDNPAQVGDPCLVEGSGVSGIDNCDISSMCWNVDPETNEGVCTAFCSGSEANPVCEDPTTQCVIANEGTLILCLPTCDPLAQDCTNGQNCYPIDDGFACAPDAGGEQGAYGEGCEFLNVCDAGLFCANPDAVPDCAGAAGCCSEFCDLSAADPDAACSGAAGGQVCTPWYEEGQSPPGYEDVGACAIPA